MTLNKSQRYIAYILLAEEIEHNAPRARGICATSYCTFGIDIYELSEFRRYFPELFRKKPKGKRKNDYWFTEDAEGSKQRIALLEECIEETHPVYKTSTKTNHYE